MNGNRFPQGLLLALLLCASACELHELQTFEAPTAAIPEAFAARESVAEGLDPRGAWWRHFERPELDGFVEKALEKNRDLSITWARLEEALTIVRREDADNDLQVDFRADYGGTFAEVSGQAFGSSTDSFTRNSFTLGGRWALDLWGRFEAEVQAAEWEAIAARESVSLTALALSTEVTNAWFDILTNRRLLQIAREQEATSLQLLELTELRFSNGLGTALDVLQQRSQLAAATSDIPTFEADLKTAEHRLAVLCGEVPGRFALPTDSVDLPDLPPALRLEIPRALLETRPDLRLTKARLFAADQRVYSAVAALFPDFVLTFGLEDATGAGSGLFDTRTGTAAIQLVQPLLTGGLIRAEIDRAEAALRVLIEEWAATWLVALREVEDALVREARQIELLSNVQRQVDLARATLMEARARYSNGEGNFIDVLTAVGSLQGLERLLVRERRRLLGFRISLHAALGGDWLLELPSHSANADESIAKEASE